MRRLVLLLAMAAASGGALAQDASGCGKFKWSVERERSAFASPGLPTVENGQSLPGVMDPAIVKLKPQGEVVFEHPPARKPKADNPFGAVLKLAPIAAAGVYEITLSDEGWIDVWQDGREIRSSGFTGGSDCPSVRKSVKFDLRVGPATVQISGASTDSMKVDVTPAE